MFNLPINLVQCEEENIMAIFKGSGVAVVTPMNEDFTINFDSFDELIEFHIAGKTDALIVCGTTGEASTLSVEEHLEAIQFVAERVKGRIPVVAGTGSNSTATAIEISQEAELRGADAALVVTPYYNKATQNGLITHFTAIANSVKLPQILYNVPSRTGIELAPKTIAYLMKNVDNIVALKEATGDVGKTAKTMYYCDGQIDLYSGNDDIIVPLLSIGGSGVISVLGNMAPTFVHDMVYNYLNGNVDVATKMQVDCIPLYEALFSEENPIPIKEALNILGKKVGPPRLPLTVIEPKQRELLVQAINDFKYLA
jgi:4-hydroxy-tetrahydrodipicolinate synthase